MLIGKKIFRSRYWQNFIRSNFPPSTPPEILEKVQVINILGLSLLIIIFVHSFFVIGVFRAVVEIVAGFSGIFILWLLRRTRNLKLITRLFIISNTLSIPLAISQSGLQGSRLLWLYSYPLLSLFIAGVREGLKWNAVIISWLLLFTGLQLRGYYQPPLSREIALDILGSYFLVTSLALTYQYLRERGTRIRRQLLQQLQKQNQELEQFVYVVSHDLRSPLTSLRGYLEEIKENISRQDWSLVKEDLPKMEQLLQNMGQLIDELLTLSRLGRQQYELKKQDLGALIRDLLHDFQIQFKEQGIKVKLRGQWPLLAVYPQAVREIFRNLISNAIKFSADQEEPEIEISCRKEGQRYLFAVRDNGPGIEPEVQKKLFQLFYRHGKRAGSGIGLFIVKKYVELHQGRVGLRSTPGQGTTFYFSLPQQLNARVKK